MNEGKQAFLVHQDALGWGQGEVTAAQRCTEASPGLGQGHVKSRVKLVQVLMGSSAL